VKRYGFEQRDIEVRDGINYKTKRVDGWAVFDRIRGITSTMATCTDAADAVMIVEALNLVADTQAKRSNPNTLVPDANSASGFKLVRVA
jgi:hypothetical protein